MASLGLPYFSKGMSRGGESQQSAKRQELPRSEEPNVQILPPFVSIPAGGWSLLAMPPGPNVLDPSLPPVPQLQSLVLFLLFISLRAMRPIP